jgi:hypothetical protein
MKPTKDELKSWVGKRCTIINSKKFSQEIGTITDYLFKDGKFLVCLDNAYETDNKMLSRFHKFTIGQIKIF